MRSGQLFTDESKHAQAHAPLAQAGFATHKYNFNQSKTFPQSLPFSLATLKLPITSHTPFKMNTLNERAPPSATAPTETLKSGTRTVPYIAMTSQPILCPAPVLAGDFESCQIPGGVSLWSTGGFYSPGVCFLGYEALCTQTDPKQLAWSIRPGETVVRCVPS